MFDATDPHLTALMPSHDGSEPPDYLCPGPVNASRSVLRRLEAQGCVVIQVPEPLRRELPGLPAALRAICNEAIDVLMWGHRKYEVSGRSAPSRERDLRKARSHLARAPELDGETGLPHLAHAFARMVLFRVRGSDVERR